MLVYGITRFIIEFYRAKDDRLVAGLTYAQAYPTFGDPDYTGTLL